MPPIAGVADVAILGGGVAGLTVALAAATRGLSVVVVDLPAAGAASRAAAGMLAPSLEGLPPAVLPHALAARDFYPRFLADLEGRSGLKVELNQLGILELAAREDELSILKGRALPSAELLSPEELLAMEPALAPHAGAVLHPLDGAVDNVALMEALELAVVREPRVRRISDRVSAVRVSKGMELAVAGGRSISAHRVVLTGGAWMNELEGLPRPIPVKPVRGQLLSVRECPLRHVMYAPKTGYLVPRAGHLVVGATVEQSGFVCETTEWGRNELLSVVSRTLPGLRHATVLEHWAGLRPMTPDTLPILGPDPYVPHLLYAGGFSRNGILLAPWAANEIGALLAEERPSQSLDSFSISRFAPE